MDIKKFLIGASAGALLLGALAVPAFAAKPAATCDYIKDGVLQYAAGHHLEGNPLTLGYDVFGYNYQAHIFGSSFANAYLGRPGSGLPPYTGDDASYLAAYPSAASHWAWPFRNVNLQMKWNDAWLANSNCDGDGSLDRHFGFSTYQGSGAWLTNHASGTYLKDTEVCTVSDFVKIIAPPADAEVIGDTWFTADGKEIGKEIWGEFAIIQEASSDPCGDYEVINYMSPMRKGLGGW